MTDYLAGDQRYERDLRSPDISPIVVMDGAGRSASRRLEVRVR